MANTKAPIRVLPLHIRSELREDGTARALYCVYCPSRRELCTLEHCSTCDRFKQLVIKGDQHNGDLICSPLPNGATSGPHPAAWTIQVAEVMSRQVKCVEPQVSLETLLRLFDDEELSAAVVLAAPEHPVGIVTRADLLRAKHDFEDDQLSERFALLYGSDGTQYLAERGFHVQRHVPVAARDIMTVAPMVIRADAPLAEATAIMSYQKLQQVPVVSPDDVVVGIITSLDIVSWVARCAGYDVDR